MTGKVDGYHKLAQEATASYYWCAALASCLSIWTLCTRSASFAHGLPLTASLDPCPFEFPYLVRIAGLTI
eukprot:851350-Alexandrium_andersonii.AAC.2